MSVEKICDKGDSSWFTHDRFGMFIHWGLYSLPARHEKVRLHESISIAEYQKYYDCFNPDLFNPQEWADTAKVAGMKYLVITAKHHDGFCLWDSKYTNYKATKTPSGKDLLREVIDAFRAEGLKIGIYYSLIDWHHPEFTVDGMHPERDNPEARAKNANRDMRKYAQFMRNQVKELLTEYGKINIMWFDFTYPGEDGKDATDWEAEELVKMVRGLQPGIMINNRIGLPETGDIFTPEQFNPRTGYFDKEGNPLVWEGCQTFSGSWGYHRDEMSWRDPHELISALIDCVSKSGNLLLNVGPTGRGKFDARSQDRLSAFASWMHYNSRSIHGCGAAPEEFVCPSGCKLTYNSETKRLYLHLLSWPYKIIDLIGQAYADKVVYAQFLHDASEVKLEGIKKWQQKYAPTDNVAKLCLSVPLFKPPVEIPVVEIFLK